MRGDPWGLKDLPLKSMSFSAMVKFANEPRFEIQV
jgi:hypothetical protein